MGVNPAPDPSGADRTPSAHAAGAAPGPREAEAAPDPWGDFTGTGDPARLEEALTALDELPLEQHGPAYERLHAELRRLLDREPSEVPEGLLRGVRPPGPRGPRDSPEEGGA